MQRTTFPAFADSVFPISDEIMFQSFAKFQEKGREFLTEEVEILGQSNPYLLTAVAGISNIFEDVQTQAACIQGALLIYNMIRFSAEAHKGLLPLVQEADLLEFAKHLDTRASTLSRFLVAEISQQQVEGDDFLLKSMSEAIIFFHIPQFSIIAFGTGVVLVYVILKSAQKE